MCSQPHQERLQLATLELGKWKLNCEVSNQPFGVMEAYYLDATLDAAVAIEVRFAMY